MNDASSATAQATSQTEATHYRAQRMQRRATQQVASSSWENRVGTDRYDNQ